MTASIPLWVDQARFDLDAQPLRKIHLDFHNMPAVGAVGAGFDPDEFVRTLQSAGVDSIVVFAKDMHGYFYYPAARADAVHPGLDRDLLGEQVKACKAAGIAVHAYYCTTWDNLLAEQHPDWLVVKRDRTTYLPKFDETARWTALCLRNPDFVQLMLADTEDLVSRYELDGVWFDMPMPIAGECFCHLCLAELRGRGLDPLDTGVQRADKQELWVSWQRRSAELIHSLRPGCAVDQNNNTRLGLAERAPYMSNIDIEALPTGGWGYHYFPVDVRYARTFGRPVCGQTGRFQRSWADVGGLKHPNQLRIEVAGILAQGAQVCIGDQPPPSARLDPAVYATIGSAYAELEPLEPYLDRAVPVVEAAVVVDGQLLDDPGSARDTETAPAARWSASITGCAELLLEHRVQFDLVEAGMDLGRYRLLVVPAEVPVSASLADALQAHLDRGGAVIASGGSLLDVTGQPWRPGVHDRGMSEYSTPYLLPTDQITDTIPAFPHALYGGARQFDVGPAATILARLGDPMFERSPEHFTSHSYTPFGGKTTYAVSWYDGGFGAAAFDIGRDYLTTGNWVYRELFGHLLEAVLPDRMIRANLDSTVDVSVTQQRTKQGRRWLVHVVPEYTSRRWGSRLDTYSRQPLLLDVTLSLGLGATPGTARPLRSDDDLKVDIIDGRVQVHADRLTGPNILVLE